MLLIFTCFFFLSRDFFIKTHFFIFMSDIQFLVLEFLELLLQMQLIFIFPNLNKQFLIVIDALSCEL